MPYPLPLTRTEAYLAYKAGVIQQSDLKPSLAIPRNGIDAWLAYWTGLTGDYPKKPTVNLFDKNKITVGLRVSTSNGGTYKQAGYAVSSFIPVSPLTTYVLVCGTAAGGSFFSWYDSSKHYIRGSGWQNKMTWKSPANARYIKFDFKESEKDIVQFEKAPLSPYSPYTNEPLILQEEEAYIAYLCGVINEYPEKCLRRVGAYLRYIISARWGRPDHPLNREELYLSLIKTQFIPSGDPSSDITIDGTTKAPFVDIKMYGDTFQQTYTGKNLFDKDNYNILGCWPTSVLAHGNNWAIWIPCEPNTTYSVTKMICQPTDHNRFRIATTAVEPNYGVAVVDAVNPGANNTTGQITTGATAKYLIVALANTDTAPTTTLSEMLGSVQIELGSTATAYEPFVGGQPSPNPDYPQPIQTVTGRQVVKVEGKNLWGGFASDFSKTSSGVTFVNKADGTITANGTATGTALSLFSVDATSQNRLITLSAGNYIISGATDVVRLEVINTSGGVVADTSGSISGAKAFSISEPIQVAIRAKMANTYVANNVTIKPMLEKGSTATAYEPYSSNYYELNLGKNLFDATATPWYSGRAYDGKGELAYWTGYVAIVDYQPVEPNSTYTFSNSAGKPIYFGLVFYDADKNKISNVYSATRTFTTPANCHYVRFAIQNNSAPTWAQLEKGSTATEYAPYFAPIELCKLGDYQDYIWKDGEDWKVHKATSKATFSDLNWQDYQIGSTGHYRVYSSGIAQIVLPPSANNVNFIGFCSIYTNKTSSRTYAREEGCSIQGDGYTNTGTIFIYDEDYDYSGSSTDWKTARGAGQIYFVLKTATDTVITDTTLIAQLEALKNGGAENGTTYIKVNATDPNLPGLLYVEAPKYD